MTRIPIGFREKLQEEETALGLTSMLDTMGYVLDDYFHRGQSPKAETAVVKLETASKHVADNVGAAQKPAPGTVSAVQAASPASTPVTAATAKLETESPVSEKAKTLYGGLIYVA